MTQPAATPSQDALHASHGAGQPAAVGVLLINVGSPAAPEPAAVRRYLAEFLGDPRVIVPPPPRWLWWLILHGVILRVRPARSARLYRKIWTPEGSPLIAISERQRAALEACLRRRSGGGTAEGPGAGAPEIHVALGMRYGEPSIARALARLKAARCRRIVVFPLFPQASGPTTAAAFDGVAAALRREPWLPELRFIHGYHDRPRYIELLAASARAAWERRGQPEKLIISFHGMPQRYLTAGDPYYCFCQKTARLLAGSLGLAEAQWMITFQSRFGREEWLRPYTDETLRALAASGTRRVDIISPAFSADCLETLEELARTNREIFLAAARAAGGGEAAYHYIPALNDQPEHIGMLADIIGENLAGWL